MGQQSEFEERLAALDIGLFEAIPSQTSDNDRRSLLACQLAVNSLASPYRYLEIGSYLGGSIQPHLMDSNCAVVISIDKRPKTAPDNTGVRARYPHNSTEGMLRQLQTIDGDQGKITCLEGDTGSLDPAQIDPPGVDLCFIDGEHSDEAVIQDFDFCRAALQGSGVVVFHDAQIVYRGLSTILESLRDSGAEFHAYNLPSVLLVLELGDRPIHRYPAIASMLIDNHVGYLESLHANDYLRRWAMTRPARFARALKSRLTRADVSS